MKSERRSSDLLVGVTVIGKGKILKFKSDGRLDVLLTKEYRQMGGGKFCISFLSDGTAVSSHFDKEGRWRFLDPMTANDVFGLKEDLVLSPRSVFVNGQERAILQKKFEEVNQLIDWKEVQQEGQESKFFAL